MPSSSTVRIGSPLLLALILLLTSCQAPVAAPRFHPTCGGCRISQRLDPTTEAAGGVIDLKGGWTLNLYGGREGFHGWMVLQPRFHRMDWSDLSADEAGALGPSIQSTTEALKAYWASAFPDDPLQRVYVLFFHETVYGSEQTLEPNQDWHMHIHLVPRTFRMAAVLRNDRGDVDAWRIPRLLESGEIPPEYARSPEKSRELMDFLREKLRRH